MIEAGGSERFGEHRGGVHRRIMDRDGNRNIGAVAGLAVHNNVISLGGAGEPDGIFIAGNARVLQLYIPGIGVHDIVDEIAGSSGADVEIETVGVEVESGDFGHISPQHLVGGPAGVHGDFFENAVIDDDVFDGGEGQFL